MRAVKNAGVALAAVATGLAICATPADAARGRTTTRPPLTGYITEYMTNKLDRIDLATDRLLPPITLSRAPARMAIAPGGRTAYVLTTYSAVWAVNLVTGRAVRVRGVGPYPYEVAFSASGATAYVLTRRSLVAIDVATRRILKRLPQAFTPDGQILQVAPHGHALFLLNIGTDVVTQVSTVTNTVLRQLPIGFCYYPGVFSPDGRWLYLTTFSGIRAVNTVSGAVSAPVPVGQCGLGSLLLAPGGKALYAPGTGARNGTTVTRIDVTAGQLNPAWTTMVDLTGGAATLAYSPDGLTLYVSTPLRRSVLALSTATGAAGPPIADHLTNDELVIGGSGLYLFATNYGMVAVISTATKRLVRTIHVSGSSGRFAFLEAGPGGRHVFALVTPAGNAPGWLVPISAAAGRAGRRIPTNGQPIRIVFGRVSS